MNWNNRDLALAVSVQRPGSEMLKGQYLVQVRFKAEHYSCAVFLNLTGDKVVSDQVHVLGSARKVAIQTAALIRSVALNAVFI